MLTLYEQQILKKVSVSFIKQVRDAIANKPIDRIGRNRDGSVRQFRSVVNSSGKLLNSIQDEIKDSEIIVTAFAYVNKLIFGDKPGKSPTIDQIENWLVDKKLDNSYEPLSIIYRYHREGSSIYRKHQGKNSGLFSGVTIENELKVAMEALSKLNVSKVADEIFNKLAA